MSYPSLPRLFNLEVETSRRSVVVESFSPIATDEAGFWAVDPWRVVTTAAEEGISGLRRALEWLQILARSGVSIPVSTFMQMSAFARDYAASFELHHSLLESIVASCWLRSQGAQDLFPVITVMHGRLEAWIRSSAHDARKLGAMCVLD